MADHVRLELKSRGGLKCTNVYLETIQKMLGRVSLLFSLGFLHLSLRDIFTLITHLFGLFSCLFIPSALGTL